MIVRKLLKYVRNMSDRTKYIKNEFIFHPVKALQNIPTLELNTVT